MYVQDVRSKLFRQLTFSSNGMSLLKAFLLKFKTN